MTTFAQVNNLYTYLEQRYFTKTDHWGDVVLPEGLQLESVINQMAKDKFGGFKKGKSFTIGNTQYICKVLKPQQKFSRQKKAYGNENYNGGETVANLMIYQNGSTKANVHITVRTVLAENKIAAKAAKKAADDKRNDGWTTV